MTLTAPIREQSVIPRLALDICYNHTKFGDYRFSRSGDMIAGIDIKNGSCDPDHAALRGDLSFIHRLGFDTFYMCAKYDYSSSNRSRDITGGPEFKVGHVTLTTPLLRVIRH